MIFSLFQCKESFAAMYIQHSDEDNMKNVLRVSTVHAHHRVALECECLFVCVQVGEIV